MDSSGNMDIELQPPSKKPRLEEGCWTDDVVSAGLSPASPNSHFVNGDKPSPITQAETTEETTETSLPEDDQQIPQDGNQTSETIDSLDNSRLTASDKSDVDTNADLLLASNNDAEVNNTTDTKVGDAEPISASSSTISNPLPPELSTVPEVPSPPAKADDDIGENDPSSGTGTSKEKKIPKQVSKTKPKVKTKKGKTDQKIQKKKPGEKSEKVSSSVASVKQRKAANLRKNIKDILKIDKLGEETLAAQREEAERRERMNMKLQLQQQQQLKLLQQQQLSQSQNRMIPEFDLSNQSLDDLVEKIASKKYITVSLEGKSQETSSTQLTQQQGLILQQPTKTPPPPPEEEIVLSSDDEIESQIISQSNSQASSNSNSFHGFASSRSLPLPIVGHFGGSVSTIPSRMDAGQNVISLSSGDEDEIVEDENKCDKEVESLDKLAEEFRQHQKNISSVPTTTATVHGVDSDDDDCVVISPPPEQDDDKDEKNHDDFNVIDEFGRVLVNVGHPDEDPDVFLTPQVTRIVKPHQIGGIRFLYDNVVESVERFNTSSGFGCILAHSMGLGKTLQAVSFCDVFLRASKGKTVLIIVPINTIQNWLNEFNIWLPSKLPEKRQKTKKSPKKSNSSQDSAATSTGTEATNHTASVINEVISETVSLNLSFDSTLDLCSTINSVDENNINMNSEDPSDEDAASNSATDEIQIRSFDVFVLNETVKTLQAREKIITEWGSNGGVLLIGYEMYRMLALRKLKRSGKKQQQPQFFNNPEERSEMQSLDNIHRWLVDPGPALVICDEGHRIKNSGASISQALKAIRTKRRVVLTGYPLQNNLMEYWCMVDFIRPNYLGSKVEFSNMFERPISNGQCVDSTFEDRRLMRFRSHVLHSLLEGFVQRRSHAVLKHALPEKQEWVFMLKMTPIQYRLYKEFMQYLSDHTEGQSCGANPIKAFAVCCKIWNHPDALYDVVKKKQSILDDLDLEELNGVDSKRGPRGKNKKDAPSQISFFDGSGFTFPRHQSCTSYTANKTGTEALSLDWAIPVFENYTPGVLENGVKLEILFEIIKETVAVKDKILVFSQTLLSLDLIESFFHKKFKWAKNQQYYRLDGSTTGLEREKLINNFNSKPDVFVFLVSTRAGSLGINLVGANRVVVLDASWNPCHDCQAVCRIYRYGQTKPCQIYRFVSDCTLEKRIYDRQINKRGMSDRVVDEMNPNAQFKTKDVSSFLVLKHDHLDKLPYIKCDLKIEQYSDPILQNILRKVGDKLTQEPFEHESLLIDQKSQRLSATEKRLAHRNYQNEKRTAELQSTSGYSYNRPSYAAYYTKDGNSNSPKPSSHSSLSSRNFPSSVANFRLITAEDKFEQHVPALRSKGICVQNIVLKKDSFLADPSGGPDMFLMAGERIYVLRSEKGTYLRISNGKLIAVRNNPSNSRYPILNIPSHQDLTKEQLQALVYSFLKLPSASSSSSSAYGDYQHYPPTEQPLPPSPSFFSQHKNHLQVTNARSNSGGDVTLWQPLLKDHHHSSPGSPALLRPTPVASSESSISNRFKSQTLSTLLDSNGPSFNPMERLSYLANRFPEFPHTTKSSSATDYHNRFREGHHNNQPPPFPSGFLSQYPNLSVHKTSSSSNNNSEIELIPISKKPSTEKPLFSVAESSSSSSSGSSSRSARGDNAAKMQNQGENLMQSSVFNFGESHSSRQQRFQPPPSSNPSFYEDFTITVKNSDNGSNSSSSFDSSLSQSRSSQQQSQMMNTASPKTQIPLIDVANGENINNGTPTSTWYDQTATTIANGLQQQEQNFQMSQYYTNNLSNGGMTPEEVEVIDDVVDQTSASINDSISSFFADQGV